MSYKKWDIVFVSFPNQEDKSKTTRRPAIILEINNNMVSICPITTKIHQAENYTKTILIKKGTAEAVSIGLKELPSLIILDRIEEIDIDRVEFPIGPCNAVIKAKITNML